jgi:hypothetical protein
MPEYHSLRPAKALTNALERLMIAIDNADLEGNHALLLEYRKACELLGYDPAAPMLPILLRSTTSTN